MDDSKKMDTRLSRCDLLKEHANELLKYEQKGIPTLEPLPSELIKNANIIHDEIIIKGITEEVNKALTKAEVATTPKTKLNAANKALIKIREYEEIISNPELLYHFELEIKQFTHETELNSYLEEARKAEFKGNRKKALDRYLEALYFLRTDDIEDSAQEEIITEIELKIAELGK